MGLPCPSVRLCVAYFNTYRADITNYMCSHEKNLRKSPDFHEIWHRDENVVQTRPKIDIVLRKFFVLRVLPDDASAHTQNPFVEGSSWSRNVDPCEIIKIFPKLLNFTTFPH